MRLIDNINTLLGEVLIRADRSPEDLLLQFPLDWDVDLAIPRCRFRQRQRENQRRVGLQTALANH